MYRANSKSHIAQPFLKWAGGKRQLLKEIETLLPEEINKTHRINCYIEPFVGGGAVLFYLLSNYDVKKAVINDINSDLMLTYRVIQSNVSELINVLRGIEEEFLLLNEEGRKTYYYKDLRLKFNMQGVTKPLTKAESIQRAALMIALNKTCFNGLFRQNSKGEFNVPYGRYKKPKILDKENLLEVSKILQNVEIYCTSYIAIPYNKYGKSLIYFDPPYRPLSKSSSFTKYSKEDFNDKDQVQLADLFKELDKYGHDLMLSNSDPTNINKKDLFFDELYKGYNIRRVLARRYINSDASNRNLINEILVTNY